MALFSFQRQRNHGVIARQVLAATTNNRVTGQSRPSIWQSQKKSVAALEDSESVGKTAAIQIMRGMEEVPAGPYGEELAGYWIDDGRTDEKGLARKRQPTTSS